MSERVPPGDRDASTPGDSTPDPAADSVAGLWGSPTGEPGVRVLLLMARDANREQVATWLSGRYAVETRPEAVEAALDRCDLCLVDDASFPRHRDALTAAVERAAPVFLPVLLVRTTRDSSRETGEFWDVSDEVVETPIRKAKLRARIYVLLRTRGYSITLDRQNERLESFASVLSHDLRNPLNVAEGRLALASEACDSDHLDAVARAHDRMESLIDGVLALVREGGPVTDPEAVDLAALFDRCRETVDTADATLAAETDRSIYADRGRLRQLFENLVRNAVEHGGRGVTITVGDLEDGSGFYVEDDGSGIPPAVRDRVFESGFSGAGGTGLGLAIVTQIAGAHRWTVDVTEGRSGGARFEVTGVEWADGG